MLNGPTWLVKLRDGRYFNTVDMMGARWSETQSLAHRFGERNDAATTAHKYTGGRVVRLVGKRTNAESRDRKAGSE